MSRNPSLSQFAGLAGRDTVMKRRLALQLGALGAAAAAGLGRASSAVAQCATSPSQTQGPYWVDEMLNRADIRTDPQSGVPQEGLPLRLELNVSEITAGQCGPLAGAYVDVWHCNAMGKYSDFAAEGTLGQKWLRGYQVSDAHGNVRFITIYPGYYTGRTMHIHFRIRKYSAGGQVTFNFTSQLYFNDATSTAIFQRVAPYNSRPARTTFNSNDGIYSPAMLLRMTDNISHAMASFKIVVNSVPGLADARLTPIDPETMEHAEDYGGGSPPPVMAFA